MSEFIWYIAPNGCPITNQNLSQRHDVEACPGMRCADRRERDMWRCSEEVVKEFQQAKAALGMTFQVFVQRAGVKVIFPYVSDKIEVSEE